MSNVENVNVQALTAAAVDFTNTTGIETLTNSQSVANTTITNLVDDATFNFVNTATTMDVGYFNNNNADTTVDVMMDQANGSSLTLGGTAATATAATTAVANAVDTLNVTLDNDTYAIGAGTFTGLNATGNLTTIDLGGDATATTVANMTAGGLTANVTTFDASDLEGTLVANLLGNNNDVSFMGAQGATTVVIGQGDNTVTMQDANDLVVLSSTGFDANDMMDGAGGMDTLEIHANITDSLQNNAATNVGGLDDATDDLVLAVNNVSNFERLILDVWTQTVESIDLDVSLITNGINTFAFDDTFEDVDFNGDLISANVDDLDVTGVVNVTNVTAAQDFEFLADQSNGANVFTSAAAGETLNVELVGHDSAQEMTDADSLNMTASGFTTVNSTLTNVDVNGDAQGTPINGVAQALGTSTLTAAIDDGATLNVDGTTGQAFVSATLGTAPTATDSLTLDASALNTLAGTDIDPTAGVTTVGDNVFTVQAALNSSTITTTEQADTINASNGDDMIMAGAGNDTVFAGTGDDTVFGGAGNDAITAGQGVDTLDGGEGDDTFNFTFGTTPATEGLTSADTVIGGDGNDTVAMQVGVTLNDQVYNSNRPVNTSYQPHLSVNN
ncbi:beta strand repeat-containing protein [Thiosulfatimonas sediminis]|nr:calcium-binding protein [Thiosulfatimonas sediminis]